MNKIHAVIPATLALPISTQAVATALPLRMIQTSCSSR
jgi:hypothetical protein